MSTYTKNFRLKKPELSDTADLTQYNESWDKVDSTLKEHADKLNNTLGKLSVNGKTPNSNGEITLTADDVNAATEEFVEDYVEDKLALVTGKPLEENSISGKVITSGTLPADRLEGSLPITKGGTGATSASSAREALGITPENIGAVPLDGSAPMTDTLKIKKRTGVAIELIRHSSDGTISDTITLENKGGVASLKLRGETTGSETELLLKKGCLDLNLNGTAYLLFGEHNTDLLKNYVLPLDGSVPMTGNLTIEQAAGMRIKLKNTDSGREGRIEHSGNGDTVQMSNYGDDDNRCHVNLNKETSNLNTMLQLNVRKEGNNVTYNIFGEHNKPTGFYSGNGSAEQRTIPIGGVGSILWIKSAKYLTFVWNFGGFTLDGVNGSVKFHPSSQLDFEDGVLTIASTHSAINDSTNVHYYGYVG